ncbi:uncharacterized protein K441DRAFT_672448 [Cenococcum geophilum 1.58]|uniref:uncharacterized protein n=1 Tax=Cenococcum geophilum 1.58 TaxID=794803 RepID=UPI00358FC338|nr:hypothetical protein K441DRAFT_672448 [Cenococcum geophilum 1.58]
MALLVIYGNNVALIDEDPLCAPPFASHYHRPQTGIFASFTFVGLLVWLPLFSESLPLRAKVAVAVVVMLYKGATRLISFGPWIKSRLHLAYSTAIDISHEVDRAAAFYIIVLAIGLNLRALRAVWTLVVTFSALIGYMGLLIGGHVCAVSVAWDELGSAIIDHTGLSVFLVLGEIIGSLERGAQVFESWMPTEMKQDEEQPSAAEAEPSSSKEA